MAQEYTTEISNEVMTVTLANPNILMWRLYLAGFGLWALGTLIWILQIVLAFMEHTNVRDATMSFSPLAGLFAFLLLSMTGVYPWRCVFDIRRNEIGVNNRSKFKLSEVTGASMVKVPLLRAVRHVNLARTSGGDVTIRHTISAGPEDDARLEEVIRRINEFLSVG